MGFPSGFIIILIIKQGFGPILYKKLCPPRKKYICCMKKLFNNAKTIS